MKKWSTTHRTKWAHKDTAILLEQALNISTQLKNKKNYIKCNLIKIIEVIREEIKKYLKEIKENR